jgi:voltage-gated potassium channel
VFATVGFGDITPVSTPMRMVVTVQMLLNLVILGVVIKLIASAAQRGMRQRAQDPSHPASRFLPPPGDDTKES